MNRLTISRWLLAGASLLVSVGQTLAQPAAADAPPQASSAPPADCLATLDRLSAGIPVAETGPALRRNGLRIRTPIIVADGTITETDVVSAARVRVSIDDKGFVVPDSVAVQQAVGDPKLPLALSKAVPETLSFDVSGAFTVPKQFAFTTVYVVCARK